MLFVISKTYKQKLRKRRNHLEKKTTSTMYMYECSIKNSITITTNNIYEKSKKLFPFFGSVEKWTNKLMRKLIMLLYKSRTVVDRILKWVLKSS